MSKYHIRVTSNDTAYFLGRPLKTYMTLTRQKELMDIFENIHNSYYYALRWVVCDYVDYTNDILIYNDDTKIMKINDILLHDRRILENIALYAYHTKLYLIDNYLSLYKINYAIQDNEYENYIHLLKSDFIIDDALNILFFTDNDCSDDITTIKLYSNKKVHKFKYDWPEVNNERNIK